MDKIRFPFRVKVNGAYYNPGEVIQVEDATEYIKQGAEAVSVASKIAAKADSLFGEEPKEPKRAGRPKKSE